VHLQYILMPDNIKRNIHLYDIILSQSTTKLERIGRWQIKKTIQKSLKLI